MVWDSGVVDDWVVPYRRTLLGMAGVQARDGASKLKVIVRTEEQRLLADLAERYVMEHLPRCHSCGTLHTIEYCNTT